MSVCVCEKEKDSMCVCVVVHYYAMQWGMVTVVAVLHQQCLTTACITSSHNYPVVVADCDVIALQEYFDTLSWKCAQKY